MSNTATQRTGLASPLVAHIAPLLLFMAFLEAAGWFKIENSALPWYQRAPEHWLYPLQCLVVGGVLWWLRSQYTLKPWRGLGLAVVLAAIGIAVWIAPSWIPHTGEAWWHRYLGMVKRDDGFDPTIFANGSPEWWTTVLLRFARMTIIVPLVEELFWRGFLMRYLQAGDKPFTQVPFGQHSWKAFWIVTLAVMLIHNTEDWLAAFVWGALMYALAVRTKSLGACVLMHGVGNLLLGLYVMRTHQWGFW